MYLVVGLGNPGRKYEATRHNVGFLVAAEVARRGNAAQVRRQFDGETTEVQVGGERLLILCPSTYMNRSGTSVRRAVDFYKLDLERLLVVCDDFQLDLARLRFRARGSDGGQKGLRDVIRHLGTEQFGRLRIGIGAPPAGWQVADYVLSKFHPDEQAAVQTAVRTAAGAVEDWVQHGLQYCMNQYNAAS